MQADGRLKRHYLLVVKGDKTMRKDSRNTFRRGFMMGFTSPFTALSHSPRDKRERKPFQPRSQAEIFLAQRYRAANMVNSAWKRVGDALYDGFEQEESNHD